MNPPILCPYRRDVRPEGAEELATCDLLATAFRSEEPRFAGVGRDVCGACCRSAGDSASHWNPVVASLIYDRADRHLEGRPADPDAEKFHRLKDAASCRLQHLSSLVNRAPGAIGVTGAGERRLEAVQPAGDRRLTWAAAVLTAPRPTPTLAATLASLNAAGFDRVHVFAEPSSVIPAHLAAVPVVRHSRHQGPLRNFICAASHLLDRHPDADCYGIFEDDISAALGLRRWCDGQFWPGGHGIVSLYTSRVFTDDRPGWQTLNLGRYRTFGALAFVFRADTLRQFLADPDVRYHVDSGYASTDAVVGEWALKRGTGLAYHSPSLIQHTGETTSLAGHGIGRVGRAIAVDRAEDVVTWRPPPARFGRVGLVGWNTATGLGYQNRDIARHLPVTRWLAPRHPRFARLSAPRMPGEYWAPWGRGVSTRDMRRWLDGLDWLLFVELPYLPGIVQLAREKGISVACVPNWEWLTTGLDWLPYVDLMLCPTRATHRMLCQWRHDHGFAWDVAHVPWPIDPARFPFRRRERCGRFLFVNGTAGGRARRLDGSVTPYRRKGVELIAATASMLRTIPFLVYSQNADMPPMPDNVEVRRPPRDNADLYIDGDVCIQPSHWEGLGLQLLECQAAGLPLVTTDASPMNECRPFRAAPVSETEIVFVYGDHPVDAHVIDPEAFAHLLNEVRGADLREASESARDYIERERSWVRSRELLAARLTA